MHISHHLATCHWYLHVTACNHHKPNPFLRVKFKDRTFDFIEIDHEWSWFITLYDHSWFINHSHYLWSLFYDHLISWFSRFFHFSKTPSRPPFPLWHSLTGKVSVSRILSRWRACWTSRCCFKAASGGEWKRWENVSGNQRAHHEIYRDRGSPWSWKWVPSSNPVVKDILF